MSTDTVNNYKTCFLRLVVSLLMVPFFRCTSSKRFRIFAFHLESSASTDLLFHGLQYAELKLIIGLKAQIVSI